MAYRLFNNDEPQASLLDLVDNVVHQGVVLHGDLMLGLAGVDLIYAQLSLLLSAAERGTGRVDDSAAGPRVTKPRDLHLLPAAQAQRKPAPPRATRNTRGPTQQPAGPRRPLGLSGKGTGQPPPRGAKTVATLRRASPKLREGGRAKGKGKV